MKRFFLILTAMTGLFSLSTAHALLGFSIGGHVGVMEFDSDYVDETTIFGANVGYKIKDFIVADLAVDVELNTTIDDFENSITNVDFSYDSQALYLTGKTLGPVYAIGRVGLVRGEIDGGGISDSDNGTAFSVGVGFSLGTQIELLYKSISFDDFEDAQQINLRIGF